MIKTRVPKFKVFGQRINALSAINKNKLKVLVETNFTLLYLVNIVIVYNKFTFKLVST